jgi:hypothetical protein
MTLDSRVVYIFDELRSLRSSVGLDSDQKLWEDLLSSEPLTTSTCESPDLANSTSHVLTIATRPDRIRASWVPIISQRQTRLWWLVFKINDYNELAFDDRLAIEESVNRLFGHLAFNVHLGDAVDQRLPDFGTRHTYLHAALTYSIYEALQALAKAVDWNERLNALSVSICRSLEYYRNDVFKLVRQTQNVSELLASLEIVSTDAEQRIDRSLNPIGITFPSLRGISGAIAEVGPVTRRFINHGLDGQGILGDLVISSFLQNPTVLIRRAFNVIYSFMSSKTQIDPADANQVCMLIGSEVSRVQENVRTAIARAAAAGPPPSGEESALTLLVGRARKLRQVLTESNG